MRLSTTLLASVGLIGSVTAQATNNEFFLYSGSTNFTTRSTLPGASEGEICMRYPAEFFNGLGQSLDATTGQTVNRIGGLRYVLQDQSAITQEPFEIGLKADDALAPGNVDPTNDLVRAGPFNTPSSSSTGAAAWIFTSTFATAYDAPSGQADIWAFVDVPANPAWTADGCSIHMSGWTSSPVDNPALTATVSNFVNVVDQTAIAAGTAPQAAVAVNNTRFQRIWLLTPGTTLKLGADVDPNAQVCPNPNYGAAGLYPDQNAGRTDGLAFRILDANVPNSLVTVLGTFGPTTTNPPIPLAGFVPGSVGNIYLAFPLLSDAFATGTTDATGLFEQTTFAYPFLVPAPVGVMSFQAIVVDLVNFRFVASNSASFNAQ